MSARGQMGELEQQVCAVIPTAVRVDIGQMSYTATGTTIAFEARLDDGSWITGEWERGAR